MKDRSRLRHLAKTITWRVIASLTTFLLAYFFFRHDKSAIEKASGVAVAEAAIKMVLYYLHERAWYKANLGLEKEKRKSLKE